MSSVMKGILAAFAICGLVLMVSCQKCLVCDTVGTECYRCISTGGENIYCEVDSALLAQLIMQCSQLDSLTAPQQIEQCSENSEQLNFLRTYYEDFNLDCRIK